MIIDRVYQVDTTRPLTMRTMADALVTGDKNAHRIIVRVPDQTVAGSVTGYLMRSDGETVLISGTVEDEHAAAVILEPGCYDVPGWAQLVVRVTQGDSITTLLALTMHIIQGSTETIIDPGHAVPSLDELLAQIDRMEQATAAAETVAGPVLETVAGIRANVQQLTEQVEDLAETAGEIETAGNRLENLESAAEGNIFRAVTNADAARVKTVPANALPWADLGIVGAAAVIEGGAIVNHAPARIVSRNASGDLLTEIDVSAIAADTDAFPDGMRGINATVADYIDMQRGMAVRRVGDFILTQAMVTKAIGSGSGYSGTTTIDGVRAVWVRNIATPTEIRYVYGGSNGFAAVSPLGKVEINATKYSSSQYRMYFHGFDSVDALLAAIGDGAVIQYRKPEAVETKTVVPVPKDVPVAAGGTVTFESTDGDAVDLPSRLIFKVRIAGGSGGGSYDDTELRGRVEAVEGAVAGKADAAAVEAVQQELGTLSSDIATLNNGEKTAAAGQVWTATEDGAGWAVPQGKGEGVSMALKAALREYFVHVNGTFDDENGLSYINAIIDALDNIPQATLVNISAVCNEPQVPADISASDIDITVTANWSDGSSTVVKDYTVSGIVAVGENTFTVTYNGKTATFTVIGYVVETGIIYKLPEPVTMAGDKHIDTGIVGNGAWLLANAWTILIDVYWDENTFYALDNSLVHNGYTNTLFKCDEKVFVDYSKSYGDAGFKLANTSGSVRLNKSATKKNGTTRIAIIHDANDLYIAHRVRNNYGDVSQHDRIYPNMATITTNNNIVIGAINVDGAAYDSFWGTVNTFVMYDHNKGLDYIEAWTLEVVEQ